ncbi:MAG: HAD family hydrolase [Prochloraceae cyanobacterium]
MRGVSKHPLPTLFMMNQIKPDLSKYLALATDYDGTIAKDGRVKLSTRSAISSLRNSGKKIILVTGRRIVSLSKVFDNLKEFDLIVAENGAVIYDPNTGKSQLLAQKPPQDFIATLEAKQVTPLTVGEVVVATWKPHDRTVTRVIQAMNLPLEIILNKKAVMVLPKKINKASGLKIAIDRLNLAPENIVGIGDAENDLDLLNISGFGIAVANALPILKQQADWVTTKSRGEGVEEAISLMLT